MVLGLPDDHIIDVDVLVVIILVIVEELEG